MKPRKAKFYTFPDSNICIEKILGYFDFLTKEHGCKIKKKQKNITLILSLKIKMTID
jgi:hypothetical protein